MAVKFQKTIQGTIQVETTNDQDKKTLIIKDEEVDKGSPEIPIVQKAEIAIGDRGKSASMKMSTSVSSTAVARGGSSLKSSPSDSRAFITAKAMSYGVLLDSLGVYNIDSSSAQTILQSVGIDQSRSMIIMSTEYEPPMYRDAIVNQMPNGRIIGLREIPDSTGVGVLMDLQFQLKQSHYAMMKSYFETETGPSQGQLTQLGQLYGAYSRTASQIIKFLGYIYDDVERTTTAMNVKLGGYSGISLSSLSTYVNGTIPVWTSKGLISPEYVGLAPGTSTLQTWVVELINTGKFPFMTVTSQQVTFALLLESLRSATRVLGPSAESTIENYQAPSCGEAQIPSTAGGTINLSMFGRNFFTYFRAKQIQPQPATLRAIEDVLDALSSYAGGLSTRDSDIYGDDFSLYMDGTTGGNDIVGYASESDLEDGDTNTENNYLVATRERYLVSQTLANEMWLGRTQGEYGSSFAKIGFGQELGEMISWVVKSLLIGNKVNGIAGYGFGGEGFASATMETDIFGADYTSGDGSEKTWNSHSGPPVESALNRTFGSGIFGTSPVDYFARDIAANGGVNSMRNTLIPQNEANTTKKVAQFETSLASYADGFGTSIPITSGFQYFIENIFKVADNQTVLEHIQHQAQRLNSVARQIENIFKISHSEKGYTTRNTFSSYNDMAWTSGYLLDRVLYRLWDWMSKNSDALWTKSNSTQVIPPGDRSQIILLMMAGYESRHGVTFDNAGNQASVFWSLCRFNIWRQEYFLAYYDSPRTMANSSEYIKDQLSQVPWIRAGGNGDIDDQLGAYFNDLIREKAVDISNNAMAPLERDQTNLRDLGLYAPFIDLALCVDRFANRIGHGLFTSFDPAYDGKNTMTLDTAGGNRNLDYAGNVISLGQGRNIDGNCARWTDLYKPMYPTTAARDDIPIYTEGDQWQHWATSLTPLDLIKWKSVNGTETYSSSHDGSSLFSAIWEAAADVLEAINNEVNSEGTVNLDNYSRGTEMNKIHFHSLYLLAFKIVSRLLYDSLEITTIVGTPDWVYTGETEETEASIEMVSGIEDFQDNELNSSYSFEDLSGASAEGVIDHFISEATPGTTGVDDVENAEFRLFGFDPDDSGASESFEGKKTLYLFNQRAALSLYKAIDLLYSSSEADWASAMVGNYYDSTTSSQGWLGAETGNAQASRRAVNAILSNIKGVYHGITSAEIRNLNATHFSYNTIHNLANAFSLFADAITGSGIGNSHLDTFSALMAQITSVHGDFSSSDTASFAMLVYDQLILSQYQVKMLATPSREFPYLPAGRVILDRDVKLFGALLFNAATHPKGTSLGMYQHIGTPFIGPGADTPHGKRRLVAVGLPLGHLSTLRDMAVAYSSTLGEGQRYSHTPLARVFFLRKNMVTDEIEINLHAPVYNMKLFTMGAAPATDGYSLEALKQMDYSHLLRFIVTGHFQPEGLMYETLGFSPDSFPYQPISENGVPFTAMDLFSSAAVNYYCKLYLRLTSGIDLAEDHFCLSRRHTEIAQDPILGDKAELFSKLVEDERAKLDVSLESSIEIERFQEDLRRSTFFSSDKYLMRIITPKEFDRILCTIVDDYNYFLVNFDKEGTLGGSSKEMLGADSPAPSGFILPADIHTIHKDVVDKFNNGIEEDRASNYRNAGPSTLSRTTDNMGVNLGGAEEGPAADVTRPEYYQHFTIVSLLAQDEVFFTSSSRLVVPEGDSTDSSKSVGVDTVELMR